MIEIALEHSAKNPWGVGVDKDEPWVEAFILQLESNLWRMWWHAGRPWDDPSFKLLKIELSHVFTDFGLLGHYVTLMEYLSDGAPQDLAKLPLNERETLWGNRYFPLLLELGFEKGHLEGSLRDLKERWGWAATRLKELSSGGFIPVLRQKVAGRYYTPGHIKEGWRFYPVQFRLLQPTAEPLKEEKHEIRILGRPGTR